VGLGVGRPARLAAESVLQAPALVLVFSMIPPSRAPRPRCRAGVVQAMVLPAPPTAPAPIAFLGARGAEAALDYAAEFGRRSAAATS
jgi:hypothetical protein